MFTPDQLPVLQQIKAPEFSSRGIKLYLKREDLIHPHISGNKWRKLKYNIIEAKKQGYTTLLTFGGAYSNHIYATAVAARQAGLQSIGVIRGEEVLPLNDTLRFARSQGMELYYIDREKYRDKNKTYLINELHDQWGDFYMIPEGGTNSLAIKGCMEIYQDINIPYDVICSPIGTGGTIAGLIAAQKPNTKVIGFSALKGNGFLDKEVKRLLPGISHGSNWSISYSYHFGGYAKIKTDLIDFINRFYKKHGIVLDPVYTGKMMYGIYDMIHLGEFRENSTIIALHTGGLQGIAGITKRYGVELPR